MRNKTILVLLVLLAVASLTTVSNNRHNTSVTPVLRTTDEQVARMRPGGLVIPAPS
jgi:hypothetical protein